MDTDYTVTVIGDFHTGSPEEAVIEMTEWLADPSDYITMRVSWINEAGLEESTYMDISQAQADTPEADLSTQAAALIAKGEDATEEEIINLGAAIIRTMPSEGDV